MNFFGEKVQKEAIQSLIVSTDRVLSEAGFEQIAPGDWKRKFSWKFEEVDLRVCHLSWRGLQPSFRIAIPRSDLSPVGDSFEFLAEEKLPRIIDPDLLPGAQIVIPSLGFLVSQFVALITTDIKRGLRWFDQFATPELCQAPFRFSSNTAALTLLTLKSS